MPGRRSKKLSWLGNKRTIFSHSQNLFRTSLSFRPVGTLYRPRIPATLEGTRTYLNIESDHPLDGRGDQIQDDKVIFPRNPWLDHGPSLSGEVVSSSPNDFEIGSSENARVDFLGILLADDEWMSRSIAG